MLNKIKSATNTSIIVFVSMVILRTIPIPPFLSRNIGLNFSWYDPLLLILSWFKACTKLFVLYNVLMKNLFLILTISSLLSNWCIAKHLHTEKYYQAIWCGKYNGVMEYELNDRTRVDCLTTNYAVEFDFANKWAECIGQALYYGISTKKKPVCLLIVEKPEDFKYFYRVKKVAEFFKFDLWYIKAPEYVYKNR